MHWDDGDVGAEVGTELMGEATSDSNNTGEDEKAPTRLRSILHSTVHCMPRGPKPGNNVMARCPHDCLTNH